MARYEHQLEVQGSGDVLNGCEPRIGSGAFQIRDLSLPVTEPFRELLLREVLARARFEQTMRERLVNITYR
jgi:hypothetical protein